MRRNGDRNLTNKPMLCVPFFPDLKTMSSKLSATTTLTGWLLTSGIGSDLTYGATFPS